LEILVEGVFQENAMGDLRMDMEEMSYHLSDFDFVNNLIFTAIELQRMQLTVTVYCLVGLAELGCTRKKP